MEKRGQFYLIAAVLIILVISGIASVTTYTIIKSQPKSLDSLSSDLSTESPRVVDYGIYQSKDLTTLLNNFTQDDFAPYFLQKTGNANIFFVYGDKINLHAVQYNTTSRGTISSTIGNLAMNWEDKSTFADRWKITVNPDDTFINVVAMGKTYRFNITEGQMFYFVMIQEKDGERYVKTSQ